MKLRAIVVDDDPVSRRSLRYLCKQHADVDLTYVATGAEEALKRIEKDPPDLVFLDIEMPGMSGLEFLDELTEWPMVIFTTGKKDYALDAFEYDAIDYLVKPITKSRFHKAILKAMDQQDRFQRAESTSAGKEIYIKNAGRLIRIGYDSILFFENKGDYILLHTDGQNLLFYGSLKSVEEKLHSTRFMRVHRSFIVNLEKIVDIQDSSILIGREVIPVSRSHKTSLLRSLNII